MFDTRAGVRLAPVHARAVRVGGTAVSWLYHATGPCRALVRNRTGPPRLKRCMCPLASTGSAPTLCRGEMVVLWCFTYVGGWVWFGGNTVFNVDAIAARLFFVREFCGAWAAVILLFFIINKLFRCHASLVNPRPTGTPDFPPPTGRGGGGVRTPPVYLGSYWS